MKSSLLIAASMTLAFAGTTAIAQPAGSLLTTWNAGGDGSQSGDWNAPINWSGGSVPNVTIEDSAVINGGGTATISSVSPAAGGLVLGQAAGQSGTLRVTGGSIAFQDDPAFPADGSLRVGQGGVGVLEMTGGSVNTVALTSAGEAGTLIDLSGAATLTAGTATLARTTRITGSAVAFSTGTTLSLAGSHNLIAEITGASHSVIDVGSTATLGGALNVEFNGVTPTATSTWNLLTAATINGAFSSISATGATFGAGQALNVRTLTSGADRVLQLFVEQQLVLNVNRATGVVSISNPGSAPVLIDGYSVRSALGSLSVGAWNSLQDQVGAGWSEANPSASALNEIIDGQTTLSIAGGASRPLGPVFQPAAPTQFDVPTEDLVFQYTGPGNGNISASVAYNGAGVVNDLVLYVNPTTGQTTLRNASPFHVAIDAYTITSPSGGLNTAYTSLDDAGVEGGAWEEANPSATRVSELMNAGVTPMSIHRSFNLGALVNGGARDLTFGYLLEGESVPRVGTVLYEAAPAQVTLPGDYNNNGVVDAADYTVWRDAFGTATTLPGDTSPGGVSAVDLTVWQSNYGRTLASPPALALAIPEPNATLIAMTCLAAALASPGRRSV